MVNCSGLGQSLSAGASSERRQFFLRPHLRRRRINASRGPVFVCSDGPPDAYVIGWSAYMMNQAYGWMGGGMWIWTAIGALVVVLLVVVINKVSSK